jgi:hypothetical protein
MNHSFAQNIPFSPKINTGKLPFNQRNHFGNSQSNGKNNNFCANEGNFGESHIKMKNHFQEASNEEDQITDMLSKLLIQDID